MVCYCSNRLFDVFCSIVAVLFVFSIQTEVQSAAIKDANALGMNRCPKIISRKQWGGRTPKGRDILPISPTPYVVIHHGGVKQYCYDSSSCAAVVRSYQDLHMDVNGWLDIGYSFVIGEDGNVYEGRGWDAVGAHAPGYNTQSIGICIIGDFSDRLPNDAALDALKSLMSCGVSLGKIEKSYRTLGHRQARNTLCPGETFYQQYVTSLPNWTGHPQPVYTNATDSPKNPNGNHL